MANLTLRLVGQSDLILHNGQTADPRNQYAKALKVVSAKRKKTDADLDQMSLIEFIAGWYIKNGKAVIPDHVLEAALIAGAKKTKRGVIAKTALFVDTPATLNFDGAPSEFTEDSLRELHEAGKHTLVSAVKVGTAKVMRTRPIVTNWSADVQITYDEDFLNKTDVLEIAKDAGRQAGIGDWRPKYGRFTVQEV
jgi:hypothetical protein